MAVDDILDFLKERLLFKVETLKDIGCIQALVVKVADQSNRILSEKVAHGLLSILKRLAGCKRTFYFFPVA